MKKLNSSDFPEMKGMPEDKHDINVNLWDLDGSSFFLDKNINDLESTATFNNTVLNCNNYNNINIISSKNSNDIIFPINKIPKNKNKSVNTSFVKYNNFPSERKNIKNNNKPKNNINNKKFNKLKNNSFCNNYKLNDNIIKDFNKKKSKNSIDYNNKIRKAKQRLNHSVDYARSDESEIPLFRNNNYKYKKKHNLNKSLSIETLNNNKSRTPYNNITNIRNNKNNNKSSNNKRLKKSNSIESNIYINKNKNMQIKNKSININNSNNIQSKNNQKLTKENDIKKNKDKSVVSKKNIEDAEKYTHYLAKKKIFTHDYELQNKLKKEQEEREAEKEMSQCTFKPQLYNNKYNNRIQSQKNNHKTKSIYEKQSQWLNNVKKKKENEREKKISREIQ